MNTELEIHAVLPAQVLALRQAVLRPGRNIEAAVFEGDDEVSTTHLAAFLEGHIVGVASLFRRWLPFEKVLPWQLRGMAVEPGRQGYGIGRALIEACADHVAAQAGGLLWCNARSSAAGFYRANGFEVRSEEFEIADVGPHFVMVRRIEPQVLAV